MKNLLLSFLSFDCHMPWSVTELTPCLWSWFRTPSTEKRWVRSALRTDPVSSLRFISSGVNLNKFIKVNQCGNSLKTFSDLFTSVVCSVLFCCHLGGQPAASFSSECSLMEQREGVGADGATDGNRLLVEELKGELSQTKLELETTLKAQHKHLKELDTLRWDMMFIHSCLDTFHWRRE